MSDHSGGKSYRKDRERRRNTERKENKSDKKDLASGDPVLDKMDNPVNNDGCEDNKTAAESENQVTGTEESSLSSKSVEVEATNIEGGTVTTMDIPVIDIERLEREKEEMERAQLDSHIREIEARLAWKENLRKLNTEAAKNRPDDDRHLYKLDSSLKKNTAFIRKCKTFSDGQKAQLMKEMAGLNLTKYIGEVASGIVESKLKMSDIPATVEFCSAIHQKYAEFSQSLLENWNKILSMKKDDKVANPSKLRVDLRLYSELVSVEVFTLKEGLPLLGNVLMTLVAQDKESLSNVSIIISFCKHCGEDYAGLVPYTISKLASKYSQALPTSKLLPPEKQKPLNNILKDYYQCLSKALIELHKKLATLERGNRRQMLTRGEISATRKEEAERLHHEKEKLLQNTQQMAEALGVDMVELPTVQSEKDEEEEAELAAQVTEDNIGSLWDDDDTKAFYETFPDLLSVIPSILYKESKEEAEAETKNTEKETKTKEKNGEEYKEDEEDMGPDEEEVEEVNLEDDEEIQEAINLSNKMAFDAFLSQLPNCVNREMVDNAAAEFCMSHNTKLNRRRLVKALFTVHRTRTDLLPFYGRFVATLNPCMPDVATQLVALLKQDFRWQVRKKDQINIESKLKICRFIGEMVKFNLFPKPDVLFCMKQLLFNFSHHHIEMACTLMESCGRFLYKTPDTRGRTKFYLEQMLRKKSVLSLDSRYVAMIENAYYLVAPPDVPVETRKERPPLHQYIRKLIYVDLNKANCEKILRQVRKFDWDDPLMAAYIIKTIKNAWNVKFFNIRYVASILAGLVKYHEWIGAVITDDVLEEIRLGMEAMNPKFNQRRTSMIKFLGELYNYKMVDSTLIFKVLYSLITFGVVLDHDADNSTLDPPENMIRLRLVCILLDTCGLYFSTGASKKKLDFFLLYFQRYYWFKRSHPVYIQDENKFPLGISSIVHETITSLRPKFKQVTSFEEACKAVLKVENDFISLLKKKGYNLSPASVEGHSKANAVREGLDTIVEHEVEDEGDFNSLSQASGEVSQHSQNRSSSQAGREEWTGTQEDDDEDHESRGRDDEEDEDEVSVDEGVIQGDEELVLPVAPVRVDCPEDQDFVSALEKMMNDSFIESRNMARDKGSMAVLTAPVSSSKGKKTWEQIQEESTKDDHEVESKVKVSIMLRKPGGGGGGPGNKNVKEITVSAHSQLGEQFIARELREAREKATLKQKTLEISELQEEEELNEAIAQMQRVSLLPPSGRKQFKPQKGVPELDAIFGTKKHK